MFGLVKKITLDAVQSQLDEALKTINRLQAKLDSPDLKQASKIYDIEARIKDLEKNETEALDRINDAKKEAKEIIKKAESDVAALKIKSEDDAKREHQEMLKQAEIDIEKKLAELKVELGSKENEIKIISDKIEDFTKQLSLLGNDVENHDLLSTITKYDHLINGIVSEDIKKKLEAVKERQKTLIRNKKSFTIIELVLWNNNKAQGMARQKRLGKFLVTAFNAVADNIIAKTTARNFAASTKKIEKWFDKVNKGGADDYVRVQHDLLELRLKEHRHAFEYHIKKEMEQEEQRYMRETIREDNKVKKEIETFVKAREKEEKAYQKDLAATVAKIQSANEAELEKLNEHIEKLKRKLEITIKEKERAMSMAQLTRSGYVYILSNKGSFGEGVYKIGMTRRLDPMDRVKELGDASVPFIFDVHGMIPSDDAPGLEKKLHAHFVKRRVNKVNLRREYFKITIEEIEKALKEMTDGEFQIVHDAAAEQYETSKLLEKEPTTT